jgi:hypothetical protein
MRKKKIRYLMEHKGKNADGTDNYYYIFATPSQIKKYKSLRNVKPEQGKVISFSLKNPKKAIKKLKKLGMVI